MTKVTGHRGKRWMDKETLASVRKKHKLFRRWQETQDGQDCLLYSRARNQASKACKRAKKQLEKKVAQDAKKNPKAFWSFVKSKTQTRKGVADLKLPNGEKIKTDQEKADLLNHFFHNVFTQENDEPLPDPPIYNVRDELSSLVISTEKVEKLLRDPNKGKAPGPDGISPRVLSEAAKELAPPLQIVFQRSVDSSTVPEEWKKAVVTPILIIIINLIYIAQFDTNGILTALYIVIAYIQMQYAHVWPYVKQSYKYTCTCLHIHTYTVTCTNIHLPTY